MDVLVRGMKMPITCEECEFCSWSNLNQTGWCNRVQEPTGEDFSKDYKVKRTEFCPLVPVPSHGRLIDADKFEADNPRHMDADVPYVTEMTVKDILDEAPTVIEASEREEE